MEHCKSGVDRWAWSTAYQGWIGKLDASLEKKEHEEKNKKEKSSVAEPEPPEAEFIRVNMVQTDLYNCINNYLFESLKWKILVYGAGAAFFLPGAGARANLIRSEPETAPGP